jgi:hypothetical protein
MPDAAQGSKQSFHWYSLSWDYMVINVPWDNQGFHIIQENFEGGEIKLISQLRINITQPLVHMLKQRPSKNWM